MVVDQRLLEYHLRQFNQPYRSTVKFCDFLEEQGVINKDKRQFILDACCGMGANMAYMKGRYPKYRFMGFDDNEFLLLEGYKRVSKCKFVHSDIYCMSSFIRDLNYDGVICLQTLSWLDGWIGALTNLCKLNHKWIAFSSLFYDGPVDCKITVKESGNNIQNYNIYSLQDIRSFLKQAGYKRITTIPFEMDIDLPKPESGLMGTYTQKLEDGKRIQISGPLLMPWHFVLAER